MNTNEQGSARLLKEELLRATLRSIIMHFYYYTICINVLETSTKTNCSLVQREEHSNVCKTLQAAIRDCLPVATFGFSDLSWHKGQYSLAPSLPSCTGSLTARGCPRALGKGTESWVSQPCSFG